MKKIIFIIIIITAVAVAAAWCIYLEGLQYLSQDFGIKEKTENIGEKRMRLSLVVLVSSL